MPQPLECVVTSLNTAGFQPCDIRGEYGVDPTAQVSPALAFFVGRALAESVPRAQSLLGAGVGRAHTPILLARLEQWFGRACVNLGPQTPTPLAYFTKHARGHHSCAIVTASHNPAKFNGIKIQVGDAPPTPELLTLIRDRVIQFANAESESSPRREEGDGRAETNPPPLVAGYMRNAESAWDSYATFLKQMLRDPAALGRIAIDCMHGCYSRRAGEVFTKGHRSTVLHDEVLGDFGGLVPDPAVDAHLTELTAAMQQERFGYGLALDGDGDRARLLDENGALIDNGTLVVLFVRYLLETGLSAGRTKVVYDQKMRLSVVQALRKLGAEPVMEKSGHAFIRTRTLAEKALFGGENSGHFFWGCPAVYPVAAGDCGLFAGVMAARVMQHFRQPLSALAATVDPSPFYTGDIRGLTWKGDRGALLAGMASRADRNRYAVDQTDGLRIETADAFGHLRASVTESDKLTAAFDAENIEALRSMVAELIALLPANAESIAQPIRGRVERFQ